MRRQFSEGKGSVKCPRSSLRMQPISRSDFGLWEQQILIKISYLMFCMVNILFFLFVQREVLKARVQSGRLIVFVSFFCSGCALLEAAVSFVLEHRVSTLHREGTRVNHREREGGARETHTQVDSFKPHHTPIAKQNLCFFLK